MTHDPIRPGEQRVQAALDGDEIVGPFEVTLTNDLAPYHSDELWPGPFLDTDVSAELSVNMNLDREVYDSMMGHADRAHVLALTAESARWGPFYRWDRMAVAMWLAAPAALFDVAYAIVIAAVLFCLSWIAWWPSTIITRVLIPNMRVDNVEALEPFEHEFVAEIGETGCFVQPP